MDVDIGIILSADPSLPFVSIIFKEACSGTLNPTPEPKPKRTPLSEWGARDFSGGAVVHISAGSTALASLFIVGSRRYESEGHRQILQEPHDRTLVALGTTILWFGWLGYTGGATMGSGGQFVFAVANTIMSASVSMLCWMSLEWFNTGMPSIVGACMGVIAGLSAITAAAGFVLPWAAMLIGLLASCACYFSVWLIKERLRWVLNVQKLYLRASFQGLGFQFWVSESF